MDYEPGANASEVIMELMCLAGRDKALPYPIIGRGYRDTGDTAAPVSLKICEPSGRYQEDLIY